MPAENVVDLRNRRPVLDPMPEEVVDWLRRQPGPLGTRLMHERAAALIEGAYLMDDAL